MENRQIDLFGKEVPVSETVKKQGGRRESIQSAFRKMYGFDSDHQCRQCRFVLHYHYGNSTFNKCEKIGVTNSVATDIRLKDMACSLFEERTE